MDAKQFVKKLVEDNQALFQASQINVKAYFDSKPAQEDLVEHFVGRMVNERMNMVEISQAIAQMPADTPTEELELLTRQAQDEARHFRMVKEVIEHMTGQPLDVAAAIAAEAAKPTAKGAGLLAKYGAENDAVALAAYQLVAEGRAEAVWNQMADCIEDEFISTSYAKIAKTKVSTPTSAVGNWKSWHKTKPHNNVLKPWWLKCARTCMTFHARTLWLPQQASN